MMMMMVVVGVCGERRLLGDDVNKQLPRTVRVVSPFSLSLSLSRPLAF